MLPSSAPASAARALTANRMVGLLFNELGELLGGSGRGEERFNDRLKDVYTEDVCCRVIRGLCT